MTVDYRRLSGVEALIIDSQWTVGNAAEGMIGRGRIQNTEARSSGTIEASWIQEAKASTPLSHRNCLNLINL